MSCSLSLGVQAYAGQLLSKDLVVPQFIHILYKEGHAYLNNNILKMKANLRAKGML